MSNGNYYVGHPTTYTAPAPAPGTDQAPQVAAGVEQIPVSTQTLAGATQDSNYYVGHPMSPEKTLQQPAQPLPAPSPPPAHTKRPSLLARCFPCICGVSRVAEQ